MSHMVKTMAYVGEVPWHGLGKPVHNKMTPREMQIACGADYEVFLEPSTVKIRGVEYPTGDSSLYRMDGEVPFILDNVSAGWQPNQNDVAFDFFCEYVKEGDMEMHTAGVLDEGRYVWALAKMKEGAFSLLNGKDVTEPYFLFVNPHKYGWSIKTMVTPIRVVCWNTMSFAVSTADSEHVINTNHRKAFITADVKKKLIIAKKNMADYKEKAEFLISKRASEAATREYYRSIFPMVTQDETKKATEMSKAAGACLALLDSQPGAELGEGTWWGAFNSVTHYIDHKAGRDEDNNDARLKNAWFGPYKAKKTDALNLAVKMALAS